MKRTLWMFPRNKRTAGATEIALILRALSNALNASKNSNLDQSAQDELINTFNDFNLKVGGKLQHLNSGGERTYEAYLKQMGLIFEHLNTNGTKGIFLTLAGQELANLHNPTSVLRKQILRMQFPSPYSIGQNVGIDESIEVKPAIFVAKLLQDTRLGGFVSKEDVFFACVYGRDEESHNFVVSKCQQARAERAKISGISSEKARFKALLSLIDDPSVDFYTKKTYGHSAEKRIKEILDTANTLINRLHSARIILRDISGDSDYNSHRFYLNKNFESEIIEVEQEPIELKTNHSNVESWQRRLGRGSKSKDTRRDFSCKSYKLTAPEEIIKQETIKKAELYGALFDVHEFCEELSKTTNMTLSKIDAIVRNVLPTASGELRSQLVATATDSKQHLAFETNLATYLKNAFSEADVLHIGNKKRTSKKDTNHDFADVLFHTPLHEIVQFDAKSRSKKYEFTASEQSKSEDYAKFVDELFPHECDVQKCFVIVSSSISQGSYRKASISSSRTSVQFKLVDVEKLMSLVDMSAPNENLFVKELQNS